MNGSHPGAPLPTRRQTPPLWFFAALGLVVVVAVVLVVMRAGGDEAAPVAVSPWPLPESAPPTVETPSMGATAVPGLPSGTASPAAVALGASCSCDREGYSIDYPEGWSTPSQATWACQLFDPRPFVVQPNTEPPIVAVSVYVEQYRLPKVLSALTDPSFYQVISSQQGTFTDAGRPGTILETKATARGLWPAGTRTFSVVVDRLDSTIVVSTNDLADSDYEQNKQIVLAMAESLRIGG